MKKVIGVTTALLRGTWQILSVFMHGGALAYSKRNPILYTVLSRIAAPKKNFTSKIERNAFFSRCRSR